MQCNFPWQLELKAYPSSPSGLAGLGSGKETSDRPELVPCGREGSKMQQAVFFAQQQGSIRVATRGRFTVPELTRLLAGVREGNGSSASGHCSLFMLACPEGGRNGCPFSRRLRTESRRENRARWAMLSLAQHEQTIAAISLVHCPNHCTPPPASKWALIHQGSGAGRARPTQPGWGA